MFQFLGSNLDILLALAFSLLLVVLFFLSNGTWRLLVAGLFAVFMAVLSPALSLIRSVNTLGSLPVIDSMSEFFLPGSRPYAHLPTWMYYQSMPVFLLQVAVLSMGVILFASLLSSGMRLYQERARARVGGTYALPAFRNPNDRLAGANLFMSGLLLGVISFHLYWLFVWDRIWNGAGFFLHFLPALLAILSGVFLMRSLKGGVPMTNVLNETMRAGRRKLTKSGNSFRLLSLALLLIAFIGPWSYDRISVPPEWPCDATFYVRLEGDLCGMPVLGITVLSQFVFGYLQVVPMLLTGEINLGSLLPELMPLTIILLIVLPVLTSFFLLLRRESRGLRRIHTLALILAAGLGVLAFTVTGSGQQILWGGQLYFGTAALMLVLEVLAFLQGRRLVRG